MSTTSRANDVSVINNSFERSARSHQAIQNDPQLPEGLREAGRSLGPLQAVLKRVDTQQLDVSACGVILERATRYEKMMRVFELAHLENKLAGYNENAGNNGLGEAEMLMAEMIKRVLDLTKDPGSQASTDPNATTLRQAADKLEALAASASKTTGGASSSNSGSGPQFNQYGTTNNRSSGPGNHFPGANFGGPVNFGPSLKD